MAKRNANTELNHDNWNDEQEPEEAGVFAEADNDTIKGRIIKKAKRRGITTVRIYSQVPIKRAGPNKRAGGDFFGKIAKHAG